MQIFVVFTRRVLIKGESKSKIPMKLLKSWSTVCTSKVSECFTAHLLETNDCKSYNKVRLYMYIDVFKIAQIDRNRWKPSVQFLYTLKESFLLSGLVFTDFRCLRGCSDMML